MSLFLMLIQRDQQLHQRPVTKVWQRYQKQLVGLMTKGLRCFTRRPLVKTLGRSH